MRPRFSRREIVFLVFALIAGLIMLAAFIAMNAAVVPGLKGGGEVLLTWKGARALFFEQADPYSGATANFVQRQVYGREAQPGEKPYILEIPPFLLLLFFPLGAAESALIARAVFLFISESALLVLLILSLRLADWQPRRMYMVLFFLLSAVSFYSLWSLMDGSQVILLGLLLAGILLALRTESDELAGLLITLSFQKWEVVGPFLALILLWVISHARWRVFMGMFMTLFILVVVAFFVYPGWIMPYLRAVLANSQWDYGFSPATILARLWPDYGARAGLGVSGLLWLVLMGEWLAARRADHRRLYWAACLTLGASPLLGWRGELQNLALLILPLTFILAVVRERWKAGYWLSGILLTLVFALPWGVLLGGIVPARFQQDVLFLFLPVFCVIGMYWVRWWALRPSRTWLERAVFSEYK